MDKNLFSACKYGELEKVKEYLDKKNVDVTDDAFGYTPLMNASRHDNLEIVRFLINSGADMEKKCTNGGTPLIIASKYGNVIIMKELLNSGADIENLDNYGWTALMHACTGLKEVAVWELLDRGANINHKSATLGETPLIAACLYHRKNDIIKELLHRGASPYEEDKHGRIFLDYYMDDPWEQRRKKEIEEYMLGLSIDFKAAKR